MPRREAFDATINVQVTQRMKIAIARIAADDMTTSSELVRRAIKFYMEQYVPATYKQYLETARQELLNTERRINE